MSIVLRVWLTESDWDKNISNYTGHPSLGAADAAAQDAYEYEVAGGENLDIIRPTRKPEIRQH